MSESNLDRRIRQTYQRVCKRSNAVLWRGLKSIETELAVLVAARTEILRLRSLKKPQKPIR